MHGKDLSERETTSKTEAHPTRYFATASVSTSSPNPAPAGGTSLPWMMAGGLRNNGYSHGMYSTDVTAGNPHARWTPTSGNKCGETGKWRCSARAATLSQAVRPSQARDVGLYHGKSTTGEIGVEFVGGEEHLARGDGDFQLVRQPGVALDVLARQRFLEPISADFLLEEVPHRQCRAVVVALVGIDTEPEIVAQRLAQPGQLVGVFVGVGADLDLDAHDPLVEIRARGFQNFLDAHP